MSQATPPPSRPRHVAPEIIPDDQLIAPGDTVSAGALGRQAITAVVVALLGMLLVWCVSAVSAPYSVASTTDATSVSGAVDTHKAVPLVTTGDAVQASSEQQATSATDPNADLSENPLREELATAMSEALSEQRAADVSETSQRVEAGVSSALVDRRAASLAATATQIQSEAQRLATAQAAAVAAASKAAATTGTLKSSASVAAIMGGLTDTSTFVSPIAPGSYTLGPRWGEVGSWSRYHTGQDLRAPIGTPILAAGDGVVMPPTTGGWAGINVIIKHADGGSTLYAHMSARRVAVGDTVTAGQVIGYVGVTGRSFGPHLHFEYYSPGTTPGDVYSSSDPVPYLLKHGVRL